MLQSYDMWSKYLQTCCFVQNQKFCQKGNFKKGVKMACLKIVFVNKPSIIDNPYTKIESTDVQYAEKLRYTKQMFTSLLLCPKLRFLSKEGRKKCGKLTYLVIILADISVVIENSYTKSKSVQLLYVNKLLHINYIFTSLLSSPKTKVL